MTQQYYYRTLDKLILKKVVQQQSGVFLLEGAPGTGKTFLTERIAQEIKAHYFYYLCHHWTSDAEFFSDINIGAIASKAVKSPADAIQLGMLTRAAIASQNNKVVICLDEIDKAPQRAEALLLDFLQNGRIILPDERVILANKENMICFLTSNGVRPLMEATLRRCFRAKMEFLPFGVECDIIRKATGLPIGAIRVIVNMSNIIRTSGTSVSLQEMTNLAKDLKLAEKEEVELLINGWLIKEETDKELLIKEFGKNYPSILWGEVKRNG